MKIELSEKGELVVDGEKKKNEEITAAFLENVVKESLESNVTYLLPDDKGHPIVSLFNSLNEMTKDNSDFRKELKELEKEQDDIKKKIEIAENELEEENKDSENNFTEEDLGF